MNVLHRPFVSVDMVSAALASSTEEPAPETGMKRVADSFWATVIRASAYLEYDWEAGGRMWKASTDAENRIGHSSPQLLVSSPASASQTD
jgi:hypothetical protein